MVVLAARALVNCALLPSVAVRTGVLRACTDGGALAGPFWDAFTEEAKAEAEELGLTVRHLGFNGQKLAVHADGAGIDELQQLNVHLSAFIDNSPDEELEALPPFILEVASPGLGNTLTTDRDFTAFKGFPVTATTSEPYKSKTSWEGTLVKRDDEFLTLNLKGRPVKIPIGLVVDVKLPNAKREAGDTFGT
jgi:ribosome maturation factor RimP